MSECISIAIVDDHVLVREALERHLGPQPDLEIVWSGSDPEQLLMTWPDPDVVLLDLDLGDVQATPGLVSAMVARGSAVLAVSALASPALVRGLVRAGLAGVVAKADSLDSLVLAVRTAAAGEAWTTPELAAALANSTEPEMPVLSEQEQRVLVLYASGLKIAAVARRLGISPHTVKDYLKRIRVKFNSVGRPAPTQTDLFREAVRGGLIKY